MSSRWLAVLLVLAPLAATADHRPAAPRADRPAPEAGPSEPRTQRQRPDVTGVFQSNWDEVRLTQRGDVVTGTYVCCGGGTIEGRIIEGHVLRYRWRQPGAEGRGVWTIEGSDRLVGTWGFERDEDGGRWDLVRAREIAE